MKRTILLLVLCVSTGLVTEAQISSPAISVGWGDFTNAVVNRQCLQSAYYFSNGVMSNYVSTTSTGAWHAELSVKIWRLTVGAVGAWEHVNVTQQYAEGGAPAYVQVGNNYFTGMLSVQWNYWSLGLPYVHLYGRLAGGYYQENSKLIQGQNVNDPNGSTYMTGNFAYQVSPIGVFVGTKYGVYAEVGYGYLGIAAVGLRVGL